MARKARPWRVRAHGSAPAQDYSSQKAAYKAVAELTGWGHTVHVWRWKDGDWRSYDHIEPSEMAAPETGGVMADRNPKKHLIDRLTAAQARGALRVLVGMPDPARRWVLEAIAIAAPECADEARDAKGDAPWQALAAVPGEVIRGEPLALEAPVTAPVTPAAAEGER